jgi:hypothetical protein
MNERGAAAALEQVAGGSQDKLTPLCSWLAEQEGVRGRYLDAELRSTVLTTAAATTGDAAACVAALIAELRGRPDSVLAAFFGAPAPEGVLRLAGAAIGAPSELAATEPTSALPPEIWPQEDALAVVVWHPAQGRLGAVRAAAWLQTVLGAIGLAAFRASHTLVPVAACPGLESAVFVGNKTGPPIALETAARWYQGAYLTDLRALFEDSAAVELMSDATAREPADLAQARLTLAARWLQAASSAVTTVDALVLLGVALETIAGDSRPGAVVERITKRCAVFLAATAPEAERMDLYYDELKRAKRMYDLRSRAAHGQYDDTADQATGDSHRDELHRFVLEVALGFRRHARDRKLRDGSDFQKWWARAEVQGVFS